jgi:hypothetical protein
MAGAIAQDRQRCQFFLVREKPTIVAVESVGEQLREAAERFDMERSLELRANAAVGLRWQAVALFRSFEIDRPDELAHAAERRVGRPKWLRILTISFEPVSLKR